MRRDTALHLWGEAHPLHSLNRGRLWRMRLDPRAFDVRTWLHINILDPPLICMGPFAAFAELIISDTIFRELSEYDRELVRSAAGSGVDTRPPAVLGHCTYKSVC